MQMACDSGKMSTKKRFIMFSSMGLVIAIATYVAFTTTNNPAMAAAIPVLLSFAACPLMCAVVEGLMWFSHRSSTSNDKHKGSSHSRPIDINAKAPPCSNQEILQCTNKNYNENLELARITEMSNSKDNKGNAIEG